MESLFIQGWKGWRIKTVIVENNKKILTTSAAFGVLRKGLIKNLGIRRATGFLLRYGWNLGVSDAEEAMKMSTSFDFLINQASTLHLSTGHIANVEADRNVELDDSGKVKYIHATVNGLTRLRRMNI